jgi:hypothetical protein
MFKKESIKSSEYPSDFIPFGAIAFVSTDEGSPDGDCTIKGFYFDGVLHLQEIISRSNKET